MTRGGKRPGAGRHKTPAGSHKVLYTTRLRPDLVAWLKSRDNQALEIETALDDRIIGLNKENAHEN